MCQIAHQKVLVVDDQESVRECLDYALRSYGYEVALCRDAEEALRRVREEAFDYIITDKEMPGMNGIDLTRSIRRVLPRAVIIGISGGDWGEEFLRAGANDFRQKPFVPYEIAMMIDGADQSDPSPGCC